MNPTVERIAREALLRTPAPRNQLADVPAETLESSASEESPRLCVARANKLLDEVRAAKIKKILRGKVVAGARGSTTRFMLVPMIGTLAGCGNLYLDAPSGAKIRLMPEDTPAEVQVEQVVWFKYWGNEPFSEPETHAATIIHDQQLRKPGFAWSTPCSTASSLRFRDRSGFPAGL